MKISSETKAALLGLALNSFLCLVDGEISREEILELAEQWKELCGTLKVHPA